MGTYRTRIVIKAFSMQLLILVFISCSSVNSVEEQVAKHMKYYIYRQYEDSYDYRVLETIYEYTDSLCWEKDLYQIQGWFYYAQNRRTVVANSYVDVDEVYKNSSNYSLFGNQTLFNSLSIFEYPFVDAQKQKGLNKRLRESYITKKEKEVCDYFYYTSSIPKFREEIEYLENREFKGWRIFHSCQFRIASGEIIQKQYVLYHNIDSDWGYGVHPYELNYNYPVFRDYIKNVLSIDLENQEIKDLIKKYSSTYDSWGSPYQGIYDNTISRLSLN